MNPNAIRNAMRKKQQLRPYSAPGRYKLTSVPAPVGGINTIAALDDMPPTDAVAMTNWFPGYGGISVRKGSSLAYTGVGSGDVLTLAEYYSGTDRKLLAASSTNIYDSAKVPPYSVSATKFDGSSNWLNSTGLASIADSKVGSFSCWVRLDSTGQQDIFVIGTGPRFKLEFNSGKFSFVGKNSSNTTILNIATTTTYSSGTTWYNILASWNLATATAYLYVNNASDLTSTTLTNDTINYSDTSLNTFVGRANAGALLNSCLAELWFDPTTAIDFSNSSNRAKFIDSNGLPVSLGADGSTPTGSQPILYLKDSYVSFGTNSGSGGNFTVNGVLTAASTTPTSKAGSLLGSQTSGRWQTSNFMTNMLWVNGADTPQVFGGSTFSAWTGSASGMTPANVIGCNVYRNRMWVWQENDQNVYYSPTQTIGGTYTKFQLGDVANFGGNLTAMVTWTHDGGSGVDDYAVFIFSSGDVIVYQGDPASTFSLVGIYRIPPPMGIRSVIKFGGDVLIQTNVDYVLLSQVESGIYNKPSKISGDLRTVANSYGSNSGWQVLFWPQGGMIVGNIPISTTEFDQHVMNVQTGAWTKYSDLNPRCWGLYNGNLYFGGGDGSIYQAETGTDDNGSNIDADVQQAWTDGGINAQKRVTAYRPVLTAIGDLSYDSGIAFDYATVNVTQTSTQAATGSAWDTSDWDTSSWSPETQIKETWQGATGIGHVFSVRLRTSTSGETVNWYRTDIMSVPIGPV